jgi:hypothetical protein
MNEKQDLKIPFLWKDYDVFTPDSPVHQTP